MKYTTKVFILLFSMGVVLLNSCIKEKYNTPSQVTPIVDFTSTLTISQLKSADLGGLILIGDTLIINTTDTIINPVIQGIVSADDESGNIYKTLYLQDNTGGIQIAIDKTSLYTTYKKGQRVFVKLKGLYLGNYGELTQIGYTYGGEIGRIPEVLINSHFFNDSLPGATPIPLDRTISSISGNDMNMLVRLKKVHFKEVGSVYAEVNVSTNRTLLDSTEAVSIILRNSGYANFRAELMPKGQGNIVGILSAYNGDYQFYIRNLNDLENWDTTITFPTNIISETFDVAPTNWTTYSVASNKNWGWSSQYTCMLISGYGADVPSEDWLISPAINLTNVSNSILSFSTWTKYTDSGLPNPLEVFISTDYSGNPQTATWTTINATLPLANSATMTSSGNIDLSSYQNIVYIGFKYRSSGTGSGTTANWEVDNFKVSGIQH
ncbi:MAG: hypothetical protein COZ21_06595 [Bacteroidetes bacterium CG_4_10_14_3_um_filter_31_20]|nr:MAG: hypothetical protein COZ21_06595 [Bacteroidetes bacterium CG_4_10_14_3_um_filter_31_20]